MTNWLNEDVEVLSTESDSPLETALLIAGLAIAQENIADMVEMPLFSQLSPVTPRKRSVLNKRLSMELTCEDLSKAYQHHLANLLDLQADQGSYYTPNTMTQALSKAVLNPLIEKALSQKKPKEALLNLKICDPACGSGHFLIAAMGVLEEAAARHNLSLASKDIAKCLYGIDIDPTATLLCRILIWIKSRFDPKDTILCDDALLPKKETNGPFDAVLCNPPYIDSERMKKNTPTYRTRIARKWSAAKGNWDLFVPFVQCGIAHLNTGGRAGFLTPIKLFGADYCREIQKQMMAHHIVSATLWENTAAFENATVAIMTTVIEKDQRGSCQFSRRTSTGQKKGGVWSMEALSRLPKGHWSLPFFEDSNFGTDLHDCKLGDIAEVRDGATTAEAYRIRPFVEDRKPTANDLKLINTGLIDPHESLWGKRPIRYLGFKGLQPVIRQQDLASINPKRLSQAQQEKVLVGGMGKRIEAVTVSSGTLCGKSAVQILPNSGICPYAIAAWLNSDSVCQLYAKLFQLRGMGKGALNIGPKQLKELPLSRETVTLGSPLSTWGKELKRQPHNVAVLTQVDQYCRQHYERPKTD